jgi:chromosome segregation ATPase
MHTPSPLRYSHLEEKRLKDLESAFMEATEIIINDPLMEVFKQKQETQQFMFERIQEIINEGMREANDKYVKEVIVKLEEMNNYNEGLKREMAKLRKKNFDLQGGSEQLQERLRMEFKIKSKEMMMELKKLKNEGKNFIRENEKNGKRRQELEREVEGLVLALEEKEKQEMVAVSTIKELEKELEALGRRLMEKEKKVQKMEQEMKTGAEELDFDRNKKNALLEKVKELEKEVGNAEFVRVELACEFERKIKNQEIEIEGLKKANGDIMEKMKDNTLLESLKKKTKELEESLKKEKTSLNRTRSCLEDSEFHNTQLTKTIENLKGEISEITHKLSEERRSKHSLEIKMIEIKDKNSEYNLHNNNLKDELNNLKQEVKKIAL